MSSFGFNIALSALTSAQQALQTIGHNISNAATPGYSRQRVMLQSRLPTVGSFGIRTGSGVEVSGIDRIVDSLLEGRIQSQLGEVGRQETMRAHFMELESIFGEPSETGLAGSLGAFWAELSGLSATPEDPAIRAGVMQQGLNVADTFNTIRRQLSDVVRGTDASIQTEVNGINLILQDLAELNDRIGTNGIAGQVPADLLDHQAMLLKELGLHLDVTSSFDSMGRATAVSGGAMLLGPTSKRLVQVQPTGVPGEAPIVSVQGATRPLKPRSGRLAGLLEVATKGVEARVSSLDRMARNLILEFNRVHSTGVPANGGFQQLVGSNRLLDANGSGSVLDEVLAQTGLPFDVSAGALYVTVTDDATGNVMRQRIDVDPGMTVQQLRDALNAVPDVNAFVDPLGHFRINATAGHRFDFSNRILPNGDPGNTFGAAAATITGTATGTFDLSGGTSFTLQVDGGPTQTVNFAPGQFGNIFTATPAETVAAINSQVTGATASVVDGRVVVRSNTGGLLPSGLPSTLQLTDATGSPMAALGLSTALETGSAANVTVDMSGTYGGDSNELLTFTPLGAGTIGVTPGLQVEARDASGSVVAILDVGANYSPGTELDVLDGVRVAFGAGDVSPGSGDRFQASLLSDSDQSDFLVAAGLNSFFTGSNAADIGVAPELLSSPGLFSGSLSGESGDNANLLKLVDVQSTRAEGLDGRSVGGFFQALITELGGESARSKTAHETQTIVLQSLEARRESISGVSVDEELLMLEQFQQTYQVAARFVQTMQEVNEILANLVG